MSEGDGNGGLVGLFMHVLISLLREASPEVTALLSRIHPGSTIDQPRRHQEEAISAVRCVHFLRRIAERGVVWRCDSHRRAVQPRRKSASARRFRGRRRVCDSNQTVCQLQYGTSCMHRQHSTHPPRGFPPGSIECLALLNAPRREQTSWRSQGQIHACVASQVGLEGGGCGSVPSPSSSFLGHRVGSSDVIDETSLNAAFCSSYASCHETPENFGQGRRDAGTLRWFGRECAWNCWLLLTRAWLTDADILDCRT